MSHRHVVVLGGTGFVGGHLVPVLIASGFRVTILSRNRESHRELTVLPHARVVSVDVHDAAALTARLADTYAAVNLVGILNEKGSDGAGFRRAHVELTRTLLGACAAAGVPRLVQMSALNAGRGESHYLKTRGEAEDAVRASDRAWTILRPSVIFGRGDGLFCRFAKLLRLMPVLPIARGRARFAPVYVGDVAQAIARALLDDSTIGETYELGGPEVMTLGEIVRYTALCTGLRRAVIELPDALGRLQALVGDFLPGKPISSDNYRSLALDSVPSTDGLAALGLPKTPVGTIVPALLARDDKQAHLDLLRQRRA
jgi:NADH dehydrogenase